MEHAVPLALLPLPGHHEDDEDEEDEDYNDDDDDIEVYKKIEWDMCPL